MPIDLNLRNKIAVITGGSKGLGAEAAGQMAAEGAKLVLVSRDAQRLNATAEKIRVIHDADVAAISADLRESGAEKDIVERTMAAFGRIDILINSAGAAKGGIFWDIEDDVWEDAYALKLMGTIRMMRAVLPVMRAQKYGRIVNVVGDTGKQPNPRLLPGASANAALLAITKGVADEAGPDGIYVNAVNPGPTRTERMTAMFANLAETTKTPLADIEAGFKKDSPFKTIGEPADVARAIVFLASDAAANITGSSITSDGGRNRAAA